MNKWTRDSYQGQYQRPLLFTIIYGLEHFELKVCETTHKVDYVSPEVDLRFFSKAEPEQKQFVEQFTSGTMGEILKESWPKLYKTACDSQLVAILRAEFDDTNSLDYLKNSIGLTQAVIEMGAQCVLDVQSYQMFSAQRWTELFFQPEEPRPFHHIQVLQTKENDRLTMSTRGMRVFGRPDIQLANWPTEQKDAGMDLINLFVDFYASGGLPSKDAIKIQGLPEGMRAIEKGSFTDPVFNNKHVEILWLDD